MRTTINSKKLGKAVTFSTPNNRYIYVDLNGKAGVLGEQVCEGGFTDFGWALCYTGNNQAYFDRLCRNWWRQYLKKFV